MATIGEIAKSWGFDNPSDFFDHLEKERKEFVETKTLKVGDTIVLPKNYKPTHFKDESCLPTDTPLKVSEVGKVNIFCDYQIRIEDFGDIWFRSEIFEKLPESGV